MFPLIKAQESKDYWEASYAVGSILRHNKIIGHLFVARPKLLSVAWHRTARGDEIWKERYNYPDWGLTLLHQHFNNPALGSTTALNYTTTYYLRNRNAINQLNFKVGLGLGYNTRPFDLETNIRNVVMTTPFFISLHFKLLYTRHRLFKKWGFYTGLAYTHYSNGSVEQPNLGINTVFLNLGLMYDTVETKPIYTKRNYEKRPEEPLRVFINLNIGAHRLQTGLSLKPAYFASVYMQKRLNYKSGVQLGFDFFNSQAVKEYAQFRYVSAIEYQDRSLKDHKQFGVFVGHELFFNKISLDASVGYYLYNPLKRDEGLYQKVGFKYYIKANRWAVSLLLKTHYFKAAFLSAGIHYKIF